ncbi:hypothetical protein HDE71_003928 [Janthinobacterium sp. S3M3]|nr:hypothetical protein [Janthinobacterium sp. S3T4]MBB5614879.1 hypothetical protein [Janthinobacterium sp. S3M3]
MESSRLLTILSTLYVWNCHGGGKVAGRMPIKRCFLCCRGADDGLPYFYAVR